MAIRNDVVQLVQQAIERPFQCIAEISKYCTEHYDIDIPYSHIWTSYIASKVGLTESQAPFTASCDKGANWFRKRKRYKVGQAYGGNYIPCPGDFIYCSTTYSQADATSVGIVISGDGTFVKFAYWESGSPSVVGRYASSESIIGYGIPDYEDVPKIEIPELAMTGTSVAILDEASFIYASPASDSAHIGVLGKGQAIEVLEPLPSGWAKVVWGLSSLGYGYLDNIRLRHRYIADATPYCEVEWFRKGQYVQFKGGRLYKRPNPNSKYKRSVPFNSIIYDVDEKAQMCYFPPKGWARKSDVDFAPASGYNKHKGEVILDGACVRVYPGDDATKVQQWPQLVKGNIVDVLGIDTDDKGEPWYWIVIGGAKGYVKKCYIDDVKM